jgi:predicted nucleic acid-binding Zn finger protein
MKIIKSTNGFKVESSSHPGTWYLVHLDPCSCTCPEYQFRMKRIQGICKHISAVEDFVHKTSKVKTTLTKDEVRITARQRKSAAKERQSETVRQEKFAKIIAYVRLRGEVQIIDLIAFFGEESVQDLIRLGELLEKSGKVSVLE